MKKVRNVQEARSNPGKHIAPRSHLAFDDMTGKGRGQQGRAVLLSAEQPSSTATLQGRAQRGKWRWRFPESDLQGKK